MKYTGSSKSLGRSISIKRITAHRFHPDAYIMTKLLNTSERLKKKKNEGVQLERRLFTLFLECIRAPKLLPSSENSRRERRRVCSVICGASSQMMFTQIRCVANTFAAGRPDLAKRTTITLERKRCGNATVYLTLQNLQRVQTSITIIALIKAS